jgi:glycosyltransferase involved in cell wall biosynthesis
MLMPPLVSILIPAYNAEKWIAQTLASAIKQDHPRKEIILVNDGSSDRTLEIARTFASDSVKIINQPNAGGPAARNTALSHAQGDYLQWLDHDDVLAPDKISAQLRHGEAGQNNLILFSCPFGVFYHRPERAAFHSGPLWRDLLPTDYFHLKFSGNTYFQSSSWLVSRKLTELAGHWWSVRSPDDDGEYFCRVVAAAERICFVPDARCYWRVGNYLSFSEARSAAALDAFFKSTCRSIEHYLSLENTERSRAACVRFLQDRLIYVYPEFPDLAKQMSDRAVQLGGRLSDPPLDWKYRWIKLVFGWPAAKRVSRFCPKLRVSLERTFDQVMCHLSSPRSVPPESHLGVNQARN